MEGFNPIKAESSHNPMEALSAAKNQREINAVLKSVFPHQEIKEAQARYQDNPDTPSKVLHEQITALLDEFTEKILASSDERPEVILSAYNHVEQSHADVDTSQYKEIYRQPVLDSLRRNLSGLSAEDSYKALAKYKQYDGVSHLLSEETDEYRWANEVESQLKH